MALTPKQQLFADYYLVDGNGTQAALKAGYSPKAARTLAAKLVANGAVAQYIEAVRAEKSKTILMDRTAVLERWTQIALVDPNELSEVRRHCCRFCHGKNHLYQWTQNEYIRRCEEIDRLNETRRDSDRPLPHPDAGGGFGYHPKHDPHPDCPECFGEGVVQTYVKDTRKLSPAAKALYSGVKQTANGIEILAKSQEKALENIAKNLGLLNDKVDLTADINVENKTNRDLAMAALSLFRKSIESK